MNGCPVVCDLQAFSQMFWHIPCEVYYTYKKDCKNHTLLLHDLQAFFVFLQHSLWDKNFHFIDALNSN